MTDASVPLAIRLVRAVSFSAAHRYFNPSLSEAKNRELYGSWYRDKGFGHNFLLEAHVEGAVDPLTGMIVNLVDLDRWLKEVTTALDHRHLNEISAFKGESPTPERIAAYCFREIQKRIQASGQHARLVKVRLHEGDHLSVDFIG